MKLFSWSFYWAIGSGSALIWPSESILVGGKVSLMKHNQQRKHLGIIRFLNQIQETTV